MVIKARHSEFGGTCCTIITRKPHSLFSCLVRQNAQPHGKHFPRTLWEYRKEHPIRASVYFSGLLAAPRLTILWLCFMEQSTLHRVHEAAAQRLTLYLERWTPFSIPKVRRSLPVLQGSAVFTPSAPVAACHCFADAKLRHTRDDAVWPTNLLEECLVMIVTLKLLSMNAG